MKLSFLWTTDSQEWQFLPIWDRKADIAYEEIIVRRSNWLEWLLSDL